jgi:hypothetical protein
LNFAKQTKAIAFADDLSLVTRGKTVVEEENRKATSFRPQFQPEDIKIDFFSIYLFYFLWLFNNYDSN